MSSKFKFTWGHGIVVALASFIIFILSLIYFAGNMGEMVEEDYYEKTIAFQHDIDAQKRVNDLDHKPEIIKQANGYLIRFPETPDSGDVLFLRLSDSDLDIKQPLKLNSRNEQLIHSVDLKNGEYEVSLRWKKSGKLYLFKKTVNWKAPSS